MAKARREASAQDSADREREPLWTGVVTTTMPGLTGPAMLPNPKRGVRVEVMEEGVGNDGTYVRCRMPGGPSGLYPRRWVDGGPSNSAA